MAIHDLSFDWEAVRQLSLTGFGDKREQLWVKLLNAQSEEPPHVDQGVPHSDEHQIRLDTNRSFVLYPIELPNGMDKAILQQELHELIVALFRKRPRLSYFQGFHDIVTVLYLTLPPELHLVSAEKLSLHRLRDSMGKTLEPVLGLLKVLRNLIRLADRAYAHLLEETSPLPYPLLSSILTLLSHDMPSLPLIQHLFDYLLCREPIMVVYVCAAIVLTRKPQVEQLLDEEGEDGVGMIHSILGGLDHIHHHEPPPGVVDGSWEADHPSQPDHSLDPDTDLTSAPTSMEINPEDIPLPMSDDEDSDTSATREQSNEPAFVPPPKSDPPSATHPKVPLTDILSLSETLYTSYPPSHPDLHLSLIMGPQSVVFTWSQDPAELPPDDEAEKMVDRPDLIVRPYEEDDSSKKGRRLERPLQKSRFRQIPPSMVLATAVVAAAVAVAVYTKRPSTSSDVSWTFNWALVSDWIDGIQQLR